MRIAESNNEIAAKLLELWEYAAEIQHKVPKSEAFDLLFKRLDEMWIEAENRSKNAIPR